MYQITNYQTHQQGWECPKCGRVYSPTTTMCKFCPGQTTWTTNTPIINTCNGTGGTYATSGSGGVFTGYVTGGTFNQQGTITNKTLLNESAEHCPTCGLTKSMLGYSNCPEGFHYSVK